MRGVALADVPPECCAGATQVLSSLLDDLAALILTVSSDTYVSRPLPGVSGSVGEHVRHALDHVAALVGLAPGSTLSYDRRERGTAVESDPSAALRTILRLKAGIADRLAVNPDTPVAVISQVSVGGDSVAASSSIARELAFVISHTIHHQALIAALLAMREVAVPERFGYAPSTPKAQFGR